MSYTLRGRLESRLAAVLLPLLLACALAAVQREWWPLELAALMVAAGLALDAALYHRLLPYQPAWLALPLGLLELGVVMILARALRVEAPLAAALAFFGGSSLLAQILGLAAFPLARLSYGEDGGELGRLGLAAAAAVAATAACVGGVAWALKPPTVRLAAGIHQGPLVLDRPQKLVGEPGAVVRGGIVVTADHVAVRDVAVEGGENGITVDGAEDVELDGVSVTGAELDGIHVRRSEVTIRDCRVDAGARSYFQGIDISFSNDFDPSLVERCTVNGGYEGIVTHFSRVRVRANRVSGTTLRGIAMTEMSMGRVDENEVERALGVGIFCGDYSHCEIDGNFISDTRPDHASGDRTRLGYGIVAYFGAQAELAGNDLVANARGVGAFSDAEIIRD